MKNTVPPDRSSRKPKLNPELHRFIQSMGVYFESYGISRIGGQMLGLLMIAHEPLSAENIAIALKVSRASVSTNFPLLITSGLAEKVTLHGDRATYYAFPSTSWEPAIQLNIQAAVTLRRLAEQGLQALSGTDAARARLEQTLEFCDLLTDYCQRMLTEWRNRTAHPPLDHGQRRNARASAR